MPAVTRQSDVNTGHDLCPPVALVSGSPNVFVNGKATGRIGDAYSSHDCQVHSPHVGVIASGSPNVFVNGKATGRIGDAVSCGGSVAQGSENVNIGDCFDDLILNHEKAKILKEIFWGKAKDTDDYPEKTILSLPEIALNMSTLQSNKSDAQGWTYLSQMFEMWLSGKNERLQDNSPCFYVDYEWLISYVGIRDYHTELVEKGLEGNNVAQSYLVKKLLDKGILSSGVFDFSTSYNSYNIDYCNSRSIGGWLDGKYNYLTAEGAYVAMGTFMIYAIPKGEIQKLSDNTYQITVNYLYLCAFDKFQFDGEQDYRYWNYSNKNFSLLPSIGAKKLSNDNFNQFRIAYNIGMDFYVKSNLYKVDEFHPVSFVYIKEE